MSRAPISETLDLVYDHARSDLVVTSVRPPAYVTGQPPRWRVRPGTPSALRELADEIDAARAADRRARVAARTGQTDLADGSGA